jgi:hypothetical protein
MHGRTAHTIALSLVVALAAACGGPGGNDPDGSSNNPDGNTTGPDGSMTNPDGGGPGRLDCATLAQRGCARLQSCTPLIFARTYQDMARCVAVQTESCTGAGTALPEDNGVTDEAACQTALDSCTAYLASVGSPAAIPAPCVHRRGTRSSLQGGAGRSCGVDFQCVAGEYCYGATLPMCADGSCSRPDRLESGLNTCQTAPRDPCDTDMNQRCTRLFDAARPDRISTDTRGSGYTCRATVYGTTGATCAATTNMQCAAGFVCGPSFTCQPLLGMGEACDGTNMNRCDTRLGLSCQLVPSTTSRTCRPAPFAQIGAQCGNVTEGGVTENRQCASAVAFCNSATPSVCEALRGMGEPCTTSPRNNCRAPYACMGGTCQSPAAPMCP